MRASLPTFRLLNRLFAVVLISVAAVSLFGPSLLLALRQVNLEDAVNAGLVEAQITGRSISFSQPMLLLNIKNRSAESMSIFVRPGLVLVSDDTTHATADVIVCRENLISLQAGERQNVELCGLSLDPQRNFPHPEVSYHIERQIASPDLLAVLERVRDTHSEGELAAQLAVWIQAKNQPFEEIEEIFGLPLGKYRTKTFSLLQAIPVTSSVPSGGAPSATEEPQGGASPPLAITPPTTQSKAREGNAFPFMTGEAVVLPGLVILLVLVLVLTTLWLKQPTRQKSTDEQEEEFAGVMDSESLLVAIEGKCQGGEFCLPDRGDVLISRVELPFLCIPHQGVSSPHAVLFLDKAPYLVRDLNSEAGTRVNGREAVVSPADGIESRDLPLGDNAQIVLGIEAFGFEAKPPLLRDKEGMAHKLPASGRVIVTRTVLPYLTIEDPTVSAPHVLIHREGDQYVVKDLNSGNSTLLGRRTNGDVTYQSLQGQRALQNGAHLRLGEAVLQMQALTKALSQIGPYRIENTLGKGGMAHVFLGRDKGGRPVAVKIPLDSLTDVDSFRDQFRQEAENMRRLNHKHIVPIESVGEDTRGGHLRHGRGLPYFAMKYVDGCTLEDLLADRQPLKDDVAAEVLRCLAKALQYAHERGVVHRDIKPSNVLITRNGHIFLADFGIAKAPGQKTITLPVGGRLGAPHYMAPEYIKDGKAKKPADLYSLGVVVYEMITGRVPFNGNATSDAILFQHVYEPPRPPHEIRPGVPRLLETIAMRCLQKDPAERYQSALELVLLLDRDYPQSRSAEDELAQLVSRAREHEEVQE